MPVFIHQLMPNNHEIPGYAIAKGLALKAISHFNAVRGVGVGIGPASCCAAFAVRSAHNYPDEVTFGNSRVAASGLDMGDLGGHAERCAITAAGNNNLVPIEPIAVLFVELAPCGRCIPWLEGGGGGVKNPYNFGREGAVLYVWYAFQYPDEVPAMAAFHKTSLNSQLNVAAGW